MSKFVVSARKYRPNNFDEVIGQNHVAKTLKNAIQNDKLAHAFLFTGPRGVGKTTCARILAKVINCENPIDKIQSCDTCSSCKSFSDNASFNIFELDAASNNSVEHIRTLIEQVRFPPQNGTHKVFIIDEVHMLSSQAFNAFLKTLEEPPDYAVFILATTEKHKILPTILSRCQIYDFKRIQINDIVLQLESICEKENITAEKEALHIIAQKADGAMRDALSIFDKISGASEGHISYKDTIAQLNILDFEYFFNLTNSCLREDFASLLITYNEILNNGFEPEQVVSGLGKHFRELLLCKDAKTLSLMEVSEDIKRRYLDQSILCKNSFLLSSLNILNQCEVQLPLSKNKRLHTEIAISKLCYMNKVIKRDPFVVGEEVAEKKTLVDKSEEPVAKSTNPTPIAGERSPIKTIPIIEKEKEVAPTTPKLKVKIKNTPSVSNVEDIISKIKESENKQREAKKNFNIQSVQKIWDEYGQNNPSKSVELACKNCKLELEGKELKVTIPNILTKDIIQQEIHLTDRIRTELGTPDMTVSYLVDSSKFPEYEQSVPKTTLSTREKYDMMVEKNENVRDLVKLLTLVPDNKM